VLGSDSVESLLTRWVQRTGQRCDVRYPIFAWHELGMVGDAYVCKNFLERRVFFAFLVDFFLTWEEVLNFLLLTVLNN